MAAQRIFQCVNRLTIQCNDDGLRYNPDWPKATSMKLGRKCSEKRLIFLPYEGFRSLNTSFSADRGSTLCSNTGIASTQRAEKMGIRCGEEKVKLNFRLDHQVSFGEHHAMCGSSKAFGAWKKKLMMSWSESGWILDLETGGGKKAEYKFVIVSGDGKMIWEGGQNRVLELPKEGSFEIVCHWDETQEALNLQRTDCVLAGSQTLDIKKDATSSIGAPQVETYGNVAEASPLVQGITCYWDKTQEALNLQRTDYVLAVSQTLDIKKEATSSNGKPQVDTYENVIEARPFVQGWQGKDITFMRSNEHSTRERERSWNTSGLEGPAGKLIERDRNARNWWRTVRFICCCFLLKRGYASRYTLGVHVRLLDTQEAIYRGHFSAALKVYKNDS